MKKPRLVLIEWLDSRQAVPGWQYISDIEEGSSCKCMTVGWLLKDGKKVKVVAPSVGDGFTQAAAVIRIPTCCVVRVRELKKTCPN